MLYPHHHSTLTHDALDTVCARSTKRKRNVRIGRERTHNGSGTHHRFGVVYFSVPLKVQATLALLQHTVLYTRTHAHFTTAVHCVAFTVQKRTHTLCHTHACVCRSVSVHTLHARLTVLPYAHTHTQLRIHQAVHLSHFYFRQTERKTERQSSVYNLQLYGVQC